MTKQKLTEATNKTFNETHDALKILWDDLSVGQRKQRLKNKEIKALLERFGIIPTE